MSFLEFVFYGVLTGCSAYASIFGGRTGRAGSAIFFAATVLSAYAATANPLWASTSYGVFLVDTGCWVALMILALHSNRFWPIWALGFQTVAEATHIATLLAPDIVPKAYQAMLAFWAIPILGVMVAGTRLDRIPIRIKL
jgi:hypothetical protein